MGNIEYLGKWNKELNIWQKVKDTEYGKSLAMASFDFFNVPDQDYFIIIHGSRVENRTKDYNKIKDSEIGINKINNFFIRNNQNVNIKLYLLDNDAPLIKDAEILAHYIDALANKPTTKTINILAHSKGGALAFYTPSFFKNPQNFKKTNIFTSATPFKGTKMATPTILYPQIKEILTSHLRNEFLVNYVYDFIIKTYENTSSNSHMDYDIGLPIKGYIDLDNYDPNFITNILNNHNIMTINKLNSYHNFVTGFGNQKFYEVCRSGSITGIGLYIMNDLLFDKLSDGMVISSTQTIENFSNHTLTHCHHDIFSQPIAMEQILTIVNDTISEQHNREQFILSRRKY